MEFCLVLILSYIHRKEDSSSGAGAKALMATPLCFVTCRATPNLQVTENAGIKGGCFGSQKKSTSGKKKDELFVKGKRKNWNRKSELLVFFVFTSYSRRSANAVLRVS